jgi:hypothetical protein
MFVKILLMLANAIPETDGLPRKAVERNRVYTNPIIGRHVFDEWCERVRVRPDQMPNRPVE